LILRTDISVDMINLHTSLVLWVIIHKFFFS